MPAGDGEDARCLYGGPAEARRRAGGLNIAPAIAELRAAGVTSRTGIAVGLNEKGILPPRGGGAWTATQVARVLERLG